MENYVLYEEITSCTAACVHYKGRRKGSISFVSVEKFTKGDNELVTKAVHLCHGLRHENVRGFLEWYATPQHIWIIAELCSGGSLNDILEQDGCLPESTVWDFVLQLSSGLCYLHSRDILYCDLQPLRILLNSRGMLKYADFTQARSLVPVMTIKSLEEKPSTSNVPSYPQVCLNESAPEMRPHTPGAFLDPRESPEASTIVSEISEPYLAPELKHGTPPSLASDIWGLGCLVHQIYAGVPPMQDQETVVRIESQFISPLQIPEKSPADGKPPSTHLLSLLKGLLITLPRERMLWEDIFKILERVQATAVH